MTSSQAFSPKTELNTTNTDSAVVILVQSTSEDWWDTNCTRYEMRITDSVKTMTRKRSVSRKSETRNPSCWRTYSELHWHNYLKWAYAMEELRATYRPGFITPLTSLRILILASSDCRPGSLARFCWTN